MFELLVAAVLIALNGVFSLSELAIVSSRRVRLKAMAEARRSGAATALALAEDPGRFLSTVQIGITLVGVLAGAFSGAALGQQLAEGLKAAGLSGTAAETIGFGVVISIITYLSVVIGELVPKNLALRNPEAIACLVAPLMQVVSRIAAPVVWLLDASTRAIFALTGTSTEPETAVTEEEIKTLVAEAQSAGIIQGEEQEMISAVLRLGDRPVRALMTPRTEVEWLDLDLDDASRRDRLVRATHARLPVAEGGADNIIGVVQIRELLAPLLRGDALDIRSHIRPAPVVPDTMDALDVVEVLQQAGVPVAMVHDEYGHFEGIVTPADLLDAIAGAFVSDDSNEPDAFRREDGSWLLAGWLPVDEMADRLGVALPSQRAYDTVAGFVIDAMGRFPATGDRIDALGWRFEIVDLDGRRIDKVLASRL